MAFTVCDCEHISWKPCHSSQLHFLPGSHRPVLVSCQLIHFGYSYTKYSTGVFFSPFANASMLVRLILSPVLCSQQGCVQGLSLVQGRQLAKGSWEEERPLSAVLCLFIVVEIWELVARALSVEHLSLGLLSGAVQDWVFYFLWCTHLRIGKWELNYRCTKLLFS